MESVAERLPVEFRQPAASLLRFAFVARCWMLGMGSIVARSSRSFDAVDQSFDENLDRHLSEPRTIVVYLQIQSPWRLSSLGSIAADELDLRLKSGVLVELIDRGTSSACLAAAEGVC